MHYGKRHMGIITSYLLVHLDKIDGEIIKIQNAFLEAVKNYPEDDESGEVMVGQVSFSLMDVMRILKAIALRPNFLLKINEMGFISPDDRERVEKIVSEAETVLHLLPGSQPVERPEQLVKWFQKVPICVGRM